jgi:hypothetical protein
MAHYRIYFLSARNEIAGPGQDIVCEGDDDAERYALAHLGAYPAAEVWQSGRLVATVVEAALDESPAEAGLVGSDRTVR